jgi:hypothetical protein
MKRLLFNLAAVVAVFGASFIGAFEAKAQEGRFEHNIRLGVGVFHYDGSFGPALSLAYGPDIYLGSEGRWSLMPELEYELMSTGLLHLGQYGAGADTFRYIGFAANCRYHIGPNVVFGLAPMAAWAQTHWRYRDSGQSYSLAKPWDFGAKITVDFNMSRHWRIGLEAYEGLCNVAHLTAIVSYAIF